jgi:RHS repeat-associated protein
MLAVQGMQHYADYGTPYGGQGSLGLPFGFTGEQTDPNDLVYLRARYLNPGIGAFASLDPFEGVADAPMSLNGYGYVHGNPSNWTDPSGTICIVPIAGWAICGVAAWLAIGATASAGAATAGAAANAVSQMDFSGFHPFGLGYSEIQSSIPVPIQEGVAAYTSMPPGGPSPLLTQSLRLSLDFDDARRTAQNFNAGICEPLSYPGWLLAQSRPAARTFLTPELTWITDLTRYDQQEPNQMRVQIQRYEGEDYSVVAIAPQNIGVSALQIRTGMEAMYNSLSVGAPWIPPNKYGDVYSAIVRMSERLKGFIAGGGVTQGGTVAQVMIQQPNFRLDLENLRGHNLRY